MRRWFSAFLGLAALATAASVSHAGVPSRTLSTVPHNVLIVGTDAAGVVDPAGTLTFHIRDLGGKDYGNALIVVELYNSPGIQLCTTQADPQVIVDCPTRTARFFSDGHGNATVRLVGRLDRSVASSHAPSCTVSVDGLTFDPIAVAMPDEDGNGLGAADNSLWQRDYFSGLYWERSDFDGDGSLGAADLSIWTTLYFAGGSTRSCSGSVCP